MDESSEVSAQAAPSPPPAPGNAFLAILPTLCVLILTLAIILYIIYVFIRFKYEDGHPYRVKADYFLCCYSDLYRGRGPFLWVVIFSPILLLVHSVRIFCFPCVDIYFGRLWWRTCCCCSQLFTDPDFPPDDRSLGGVEGDSANKASGSSQDPIIWVRGMDFDKENVNDAPTRPQIHATSMNLFKGEIEAMDIKQGELGDCWLLASMACCAEHPGVINRVFITPELDPRGKYKVRLFDVRDKTWKNITVDDYVPCKRGGSSADQVMRDRKKMPRTRFARPNHKELWAMILEKAVAKLCGSYAAIEGGFTEWGIVCLTGRDAWRYFNEDGMFNRRNLIMERNEGKDTVGMTSKATGEKHPHDYFFQVIQRYHRNGAILCCGGVKDESQGLVKGHAYSLLCVAQATKSFASQEYFRFVQIRNPWGDGEWTGRWADKSKEWNEFPYVREVLGQTSKDDGAFWMQWEDFCTYWGYVGCSDSDLDIENVNFPTFEEEDILGPLKGLFKGCADYWCLCTGPARYFCNHKASSKQLTEAEVNSKVGCDASGCYFKMCDRETA